MWHSWEDQADAGGCWVSLFFIQRVLASLGGWAVSKPTGCVKCVSSFSKLPKSFPSYAQQQQQNRAQSSEQTHTHLGFVYASGSTGYINRKSTLWKQSEWRPAYYLKEILSVCVSFLPVVTLFASGIMKCKYLARNWFLKFPHFLFQEACFQEEGLGSHIDTFIQLVFLPPLDLSYNSYSFCHAWLVIWKSTRELLKFSRGRKGRHSPQR